MTQTLAPWGTTRMEPFAATVAVPQYTPVIDPETQVAMIVDQHGRSVELGNHGTSTSTTSSTSTGSADGQNPGGGDSDSTQDFGQD